MRALMPSTLLPILLISSCASIGEIPTEDASSLIETNGAILTRYVEADPSLTQDQKSEALAPYSRLQRVVSASSGHVALASLRPDVELMSATLRDYFEKDPVLSRPENARRKEARLSMLTELQLLMRGE